LVLYTDGLVERRGESLDVSLERLCDAIGHADEPPEMLCDELIAALVPSLAQDDVAIVAARALRPAGVSPRPIEPETWAS
jgi:serine phosphatase RsbU (regulator of sigma subunit)